MFAKLLVVPASGFVRSVSTAASSHTISVYSRYSNALVSTTELLQGSDVDQLFVKSRAAQQSISTLSLDERKEICRRALSYFLDQSDEITKLVTNHVAKPITQSKGELNGMISRMEGIIGIADEALKPEILPDEKQGALTLKREIWHEAIGVVLCLAPWNYPLLTAANTVFTGFLAGNSVVLKSSPISLPLASPFERAFEEAGAPHGSVLSLATSHKEIGRIVREGHPDYVHFTGSVAGGRTVYTEVGQSQKFMDASLELGGNDAAIVLGDVDVKDTAANVVDGAMYNAGQSCCAVERALVHQSIYDEFVKEAALTAEQYRLGDPQDPATTMGPLATERQVDLVEAQVNAAVKDGARVITGGRRDGPFYLPTVLADVTPEMEIAREETFGPVLPIMRFLEEEEAISISNSTKYGLTTSIWTRDENSFRRLAPRMNSGTVFLNRSDVLDPLLPWSGRGDTGIGVGLSKHGFAPLTRLKAINSKI